MKTQVLKITRLTAIIISTLLISIACSNASKSSDNNQEVKAEAKVKKPKMDLATAAAMGNLEAVNQHIKIGSNLNPTDPNTGSTPLITAAFFGHTQIAKALIDAGADLNIQSGDGSTALHTAAFFCRTEIVELLVAAEADKTIKNSYNSTAFESVAAPYEMVEPIYKKLKKDLKPIGLILDLEHIKNTRTVIADLLK